ncbi:MAG: NnrS family protein [Gammaproteobacteria bacterium]|nr:NnrS family protein [Gammaproteobacteria bacterium]MCW8986409.1 NnrS family protein [Gammaproteobacteria bacterium]MCW9031458.1 NnrS family protein [Gammaproteobacteria bacterium]
MAFNIEDPDKYVSKNSYAPFALGFRPFFLLAGLSAVLLIFLWFLQLTGKISISGYYTPTGWHAHEMLFGYTAAVIAGFLLTAAGNWTGIKMINGWRLMLLTIVFLAGRFAPFVPELPHWLIATSDILFLPLVAIILAIPVLRMKQWSNFVFIPLLLAMSAANIAVHLSALKLIDVNIVMGSRAMVYLVILLIVVMGGRVIPFFTERGVAGVTTKTWNAIEYLSAISVLLAAISDVFFGWSVVTGYLAFFAAIINFIRVAGWYSNKIWYVPLVWILQLAYAWIILGFILKGLMIFDLSQSAFSYHAFTVGGIAMMTLGMMARVSIGHTGREMVLNSWMVMSFILLNVATIVRVILPMFMHEHYLQLIQLASGLWIVAFMIFAIAYTPMLLKARIDGREG